MSDGFTTCPRLESGDPRCEARLRLGNLDDVLRLCTADHESCPVNGCGAVGRGEAAEEVAVRAAGRFGCCDGTPSGDAVGQGGGQGLDEAARPRLRLVELTVGRSCARGAAGRGGRRGGG
ncbi:MAG: hypothetical protein ACO3QC_05880, partial [Phycisphaerales bacterium]